MTTSLCERWTHLSERHALGEFLGPEEQQFLREHPEHCELCDVESQVLGGLAAVLHEPSRLEAPAYERSAASTRHTAARRWFMGHTARRWSIGALSVAASVSLLLLGAGWRQRSSPASLPPPLVARLAYSAGKVEVRGLSGRAGAELKKSDVLEVASGNACFSISNTISSCLGTETELELRELSRERSVVALHRGQVTHQLLPQEAGRRFVVETPAGSITALGTTFAVEMLRDGQVEIRLYEGRLQIQPRHGWAQVLEAPGALRLGPEVTKAELEPSRREADLHLLALVPPGSPADATQLIITTIPAQAELDLDGKRLGPTPVSWLSQPGSHQLRVTAPGFVEHREELRLVAGQRLERQLALAPSDTEPPGEAPRAQEASVETKASETSESPSLLLTRAQSLRASGAYAKSAQLYQRLIRRHPTSAEGTAALLSLGELELSVLGAPDAARAHFDAYLARGGRLVQEARYGRIRALGRLGQTAEEQAAIRDFVRDYPKSIQSQRLRDRLGAQP